MGWFEDIVGGISQPIINNIRGNTGATIAASDDGSVPHNYLDASGLDDLPGTGSAAIVRAQGTPSYKDEPQFGNMNWLQNQARNGNEAALDQYYAWLLSEQSANTARAWTAQREDTQYQRMVADLKKAGINPYFALTGGSPVSSASQGVNYQGSTFTSAANNRRTTNTSKEIAMKELYVSLILGIVNSVASLAGSAVRGAALVGAADLHR